MSARQFRGKTCVYCSSRPAVTGDHVFARGFFLPTARANLPQVPTCDHCNNVKSHIEQYLASVLPFGGRHQHRAEHLEMFVPRRLEKNQRLHRSLAEGRTTAITFERGEHRQAMVVPIDGERVCELFGMIARALVWYEWSACLGPDDGSTTTFLTSRGEVYFEKLLNSAVPSRLVHKGVGADTFRYWGAHVDGVPSMSIWKFQIFGGAQLAGDSKNPMEKASAIGVITGPRRLVEDPPRR